MNKHDFALESFKNIQDLIKFIDQKAGAILVISGLIFTGYIEFLKGLEMSSLESTSFIGLMTFLSSLVTVLSLILVLYLSVFKVLKTRLAKNYSNEEYSLFYFEHLVKLGKSKIEEDYKILDEPKMLKYLIDQQYEISVILEKKTKNFRITLNILFISIISLVIFTICTTQL